MSESVAYIENPQGVHNSFTDLEDIGEGKIGIRGRIEGVSCEFGIVQIETAGTNAVLENMPSICYGIYCGGLPWRKLVVNRRHVH